MKKIRWRFVFNTVVAAVCVGLVLYFVFSEDGLKDLLQSSQSVFWRWILLALLAHICGEVADCALVWMLTREKYRNFSFSNGVKVGVVGHFYSAVSPAGAAGQPMQIYCLRNMGVSAAFSASMLVQKFVVYQCVSVVYTVTLVILKSSYVLSNVQGTLIILFAGIGLVTQVCVTVFVLAAALKPRLIKRTAGVIFKVARRVHPLRRFMSGELFADIVDKTDVFYDSNKDFFKKTKLVAAAAFLVIIQITFIYSVPYCVYRGFTAGADNSVATVFCAVAFVNMVSSVLPIPGASGVSEIAFSVFFGSFFTAYTLKSATLIWRCISYYFTIAAGLPYSFLAKPNAHSER